MDPTAIFGLFCNVLTVLDAAIKTGKTLKELYDSTNGYTKETQRLQDETTRLLGINRDLRVARAGFSANASGQHVLDVAAKCDQVSEKIQAILEKCRVRKRSSILSAGHALVRGRQIKSELEKLQSDLESSSDLLRIAMAAATYGDLQTIIQQLNRAGLEQSSMAKQLESISQAFMPGGTQDLSSALSRLTTVSEDALVAMNHQAILRALKPPSADARANDISDPYPKTFEWIFEDSDNGPTESREEEDRNIKVTFPAWLRSGSGVFHVVGKPGSGKSTLVKFLASHHKVRLYLEEWAASDGKQLILSKFFFWRLGSDDQKTVRGLLRGLLFNIVKHCPDITPRLFPQHWNPKDFARASGSRVLDCTDLDIPAAFKRLREDHDIYQRFKVCLFIDGLDEFDEKDASHWRLAKILRDWTVTQPTGGAGGGTNIKLCVSSREYEPLMGVSPVSQQIALHTLTKRDISTMVSEALGGNENFQQLQQKELRGCEKLVESIIEGAEGVFLWVTLLLKLLENELSSSTTSLDALNNIVRRTPKELEEFLQQILDSIPNHHRHGANFIFAMALRMLGWDLAKDNGFSQADRERYERRFRGAFWSPSLSLFSLSYAFDAFERSGDPNHDHHWDIPRGRYWVISDRVTEEEYKRRTQSSAARLKIWCKCLMDQTNRENKQHGVGIRLPDIVLAKFTHRSIPEFLISALRSGSRDLGFDDEDVAEGILAIALAETSLPATLLRPRTLAQRLQHILRLLRLRRISESSPVLAMLDKLEGARYRGQESLKFNGIHSMTSRPPDIQPGGQQRFFYSEANNEPSMGLYWDASSTVLTQASYGELVEYVRWKLVHDRSLVGDPVRVYSALLGACLAIRGSGCSQASTSILRALLHAVAPYDRVFSVRKLDDTARIAISARELYESLEPDPMDAIPAPSEATLTQRYISPWILSLQVYLAALGITGPLAPLPRDFAPYLWESLEVWLEFGAKPPLWSKETLVDAIKYHNPLNAAKLLEYIDRNLADSEGHQDSE